MSDNKELNEEINTADIAAEEAAEDIKEAAADTQNNEADAAAAPEEAASGAEGEAADEGPDPEAADDAGSEPEAKESDGGDDGSEDKNEETVKDAGSGGRRFWQKKEKKDKKDEKIEELTDRLARNMAEFDNFRKRTEKEKAANYAIGARDVIEKLLPVLDNFERGFTNADMEDPFVQGMEKIRRQMETTFADLGVEVIEAQGQPFDPNLHNAVMHIEDESLGENVVAEVFQKGYTYKGQVVRYAMVKVAN